VNANRIERQFGRDVRPVAGCYCGACLLGHATAERREIKMKLKLVICAAAIVSLASAAGAKSVHKRAHVRNPTPSIDSPEAKYGPNDPYAVWVAGTYVGRDPDPRIREALIREFYHNLSNR
jgi:hypothetical protein